MPDKPQHSIALPRHQLLALEGRDAMAFAQAQFANDVAALSTGHWQWNAWLTPKGRVIALFALLKLGDERLWLLLPDADAAVLAERLARFVFRSKVRLNPLPEWQVSAACTAPIKARASALAIGDTTPSNTADLHTIELDMGSDAGPRRMWLAMGATGATATAPADLADTWRRADLCAGLPRLADAQAEHWTPQQLSLERLRAFSIKKGCYPGQEIVARTHFLGQSKRHLALFEAAPGHSVQPGMRVHAADGQACGEVVSVATGTHGAGNLLLAVLPDGEHGPLTCAGAALVARALAAGLAR